MDHSLKKEPKLLEGIGIKSCDLRLGKGFLNMNNKSAIY